jgi:sugar (pentulose or hexulose) kinase
VVFYPRAGQSEGRQDRDRYECHQWAVRQSGFDPSLPHTVGSPSVRVVPAGGPGHDIAALTVTGALVGAAVARPHRGAEGALVGATIGAVAGAMSDTARAEQAQRIEDAYAAREQRQQALLERQADAYRRAISACLEARGYTVR